MDMMLKYFLRYLLQSLSMQDLLNENEFLPKPYNPWRVFFIFYAVAFIQLLFVAALITINFDGGPKTRFVLISLPVVTAFIMFFFKKKNAFLPIKR